MNFFIKFITSITFIIYCTSYSVFAKADNLKNGKDLFEQHCLQCHQSGQEMMSSMSIPLGDALMQPDTVLREKILSGINIMPGYYGILNETEIKNILLYMRMM